MSVPLIEARHVTRVLPGTVPVTLVRDVSVSIGAGEFIAITGPSGSGKSSLLYLLGLLDLPTSGDVLLRGRSTTAMSEEERTRARLSFLGFVFQFHFLLPEFTALENVLIPIRRLGSLGEVEARERAMHLLDRVGLAEKHGKTPDRLSGGERQRVAIARALANDPVLILGDEPTGNLDSQNSARVVEDLRHLAHEEGRAVVCVTHDPGIAELADVRVDMLDGRIENILDRRGGAAAAP